ncbi:unnamed protein product [Dracunculus medinensis]|uniref:BRO1 domain-containing protein n=1 Tax=Dracunculus medinensis TaxID=318479 RepID=A0A0N4U165_DRAME|nr:unnamed protein product [Dracunculus medinensis]
MDNNKLINFQLWLKMHLQVVQQTKDYNDLVDAARCLVEFQAATHELGHIPGQAGEDEAMATLRLIRTCMITECASACEAKPQFLKFTPFIPQ